MRMLYLLVGYAVGAAVAMFLCTISFNKTCKADEYVDLRELSVTGKSYLPNGYNPLMPEGSQLNKGLNVNMKVDFLTNFYWNNMIWSLTDQHQFRWVGLNTQAGVRILPYISLEYEHFSKHILEKEFQFKEQGRFPVEDSINVIFYLHRSGKEERSLF